MISLPLRDYLLNSATILIPLRSISIQFSYLRNRTGKLPVQANHLGGPMVPATANLPICQRTVPNLEMRTEPTERGCPCFRIAKEDGTLWD